MSWTNQNGTARISVRWLASQGHRYREDCLCLGHKIFRNSRPKDYEKVRAYSQLIEMSPILTQVSRNLGCIMHMHCKLIKIGAAQHGCDTKH
jgi:hypothetical protein